MTAQIQSTNDNERRTPWQALRAWLTDIAEGMDYDPQEYANVMIRELWQKVELLETRVNELEGRDQHAA